MGVKLIAKKNHIVYNGDLSHQIKKGEEFLIYVVHITTWDDAKNGDYMTSQIYKVYTDNDKTTNDGWYINLDNFVTAEQYIPIKRNDQLNKVFKTTKNKILDGKRKTSSSTN